MADMSEALAELERKEAEAGDTPMESVGDQEKQDTSIEAFPTPDAEKRSTSSGEDDEDLDAEESADGVQVEDMDKFPKS
ncbi:unnamed protein product [Durusdinium trenchii]|uniref:Uncharacterized protein n=1 Tax=Durusdinium trenchii TaxID=1381693 RepID=A0ABP0RDA5_9DINO